MSYYSEIACVFTEEGYAKFKEFLSKKIDIEKYPHLVNPSGVSPDGYVLIYNNRIIWERYDAKFPEVDAFMDTLNELDDEGEYFFIRIGEGNNDEEDLGYLEYDPFDIGIVKNISFISDFEEKEEETARMEM